MVVPSVGQAPRRRNDCAETVPTNRAAAAMIEQVHFIANTIEVAMNRKPGKLSLQPL